jgi:hypothetical protein
MVNLERADQQAVVDGAQVGTLRMKGEIYKAGKRLLFAEITHIC